MIGIMLERKARWNYILLPTAWEIFNRLRGILTAKQTENKRFFPSNPKLIVQRGIRPPTALHCASAGTVTYLDGR